MRIKVGIISYGASAVMIQKVLTISCNCKSFAIESHRKCQRLQLYSSGQKKWGRLGRQPSRPNAYPCEREQDFATYCTNVLGLRKTGKGITAKNGRPTGYEIAKQWCPTIEKGEERTQAS